MYVQLLHLVQPWYPLRVLPELHASLAGTHWVYVALLLAIHNMYALWSVLQSVHY